MSVSLLDARESIGDPNGPFVYGEDLAARQTQAEDAPKPARTRLRLMMAVAEVLAEEGLHGLKVADCASRAGLAHGTFYRYWRDGRSAAQDVITDFLATIRRRRPATGGMPFADRIVAGHRYYAEVYRRNAAMMRCLGQLAAADAEFCRIGQEANLALAERVLRSWQRADPASATLPEAERLARVLACIAMADGLLRDIYLRPPNAPLAAMTTEQVADLLSACWQRVLLGARPAAA